MTRLERARRIVALLKRRYPGARCALRRRNPYELLVATILSAQCTDARVNLVTPALFAKYPGPGALARARRPGLERLIHSTGFYRNKARNLIGMAKALVGGHGGRVPRTMEDLLKLPGVARKTANVVLGTAFGIADGVVVDTHVSRIAGRLGLTRATQPEKIERDLMRELPRAEWIDFSHRLILHGRRTCRARSPRCAECPLGAICPSRARFLSPPG